MGADQIDIIIEREQVRAMSITGLPSPRFSERKLILGLIDLVILSSAFLVAFSMRHDLSTDFESIRDHPHWLVILNCIWLICALTLGCYNLTSAAIIIRSVSRISGAVLLTILIFLAIPYVTPQLPTKRLPALAFPAFSILGIGLWRIIYATVFVRLSTFQQRALVVGSGLAGRSLVQAIEDLGQDDANAHHRIGYQIVGFVDDANKGETVRGVPVLGSPQDLGRLVRELRIDEIIVSNPDSGAMPDSLLEAVLECREMGISVTTMPKLFEQLTRRVPIEHAGRDLHVVLPLGKSPTYRLYLLLQRIIDVCVALVGCIALISVVPFIWLVNRFSSPGPLFYSQERMGKGGRSFFIHKFRSMVVDAEKDTGIVWASENDPRIPRFGLFLRQTRLDELPQIWNVLKGDMSLVGPRPERPHFVNQLDKWIPFYRLRHAVKPGLTGWTQVRCRYGASIEDHFFRAQHDIYYIKNQSLLLDLEILLKTIPVMVGFKGR